MNQVTKRKATEASMAMPSPSKIPRRTGSSSKSRILGDLYVICGKKDQVYKLKGKTFQDPLQKGETKDAGNEYSNCHLS